MAFYNSIKLVHPKTGNPVLVYIEEGVEEIISDPSTLDAYLQELYSTNDAIITRGTYQILFLWNFDGTIMTDVWMFFVGEDWSLPTNVDVANFEYINVSLGNGVASGDSLILLASEENLRLGVSTIEEFFNQDRDFSDKRIWNSRDFFQN